MIADDGESATPIRVRPSPSRPMFNAVGLSCAIAQIDGSENMKQYIARQQITNGYDEVLIGYYETIRMKAHNKGSIRQQHHFLI